MSQRRRTRRRAKPYRTKAQRAAAHVARLQQNGIKYTKPRGGFAHLARTQVVLRREPNVGKPPKHTYGPHCYTAVNK